MEPVAVIGTLAGGLGLFLLGMALMTDGLKLAAGPALEGILARSTRTRLRGLASGILVTAVVQSSSAVTVAAIGFVNAGLLNLSQAAWVLFGANVGTTMTGWLVALVGLKFKIEALALPLVGAGMLLRLSDPHGRRGALGLSLAGFGVLFIGIDMLKEGFSGLSADFTLPPGSSALDVLAQVLVGIVLTVLMQSSSAALVIVLTAAQGGLVSAQGAAAVVIGANIGTTVTALIAAIGATPNAKRAAAAHIAFNLLTGVAALLLLPWLVHALSLMGDWLELDEGPAAKLALFHTAFNVLGVLLIWPVAARLTAFLERQFGSADDAEGRPRHLDNTVLAVPALALDALEREVRHMGSIALRAVRAAFTSAETHTLRRHARAIASLNVAIAEFIVQLNRAGMSPESARRLPVILRLARYYEAAGELAAEAADARAETLPASTETAPAAAFRAAAHALLAIYDEAEAPGERVAAAAADMHGAYQALKASLLESGADGRLTVREMDAALRAASALRRALEQAGKAAALLANRSSAPAPG